MSGVGDLLTQFEQRRFRKAPPFKEMIHGPDKLHVLPFHCLDQGARVDFGKGKSIEVVEGFLVASVQGGMEGANRDHGARFALRRPLLTRNTNSESETGHGGR